VQLNSTEVGTLKVPTDIHHPYPQSRLVEITTRQTNKIASTGRRVVHLIHRPNENSISDRGEKRLLIEGKRHGNCATRPRGLNL
jgi:hypothetical protein